jgi:MFS family permease
VFPDRNDRARALGVWAAVSGLGITLGPVIGGVLIALWSWRGVFLFNLVVGAVALAGVRDLPESADPVREGFEIPGFVLSAGALVTATVATIGGETAGYLNPTILLLYAAAVVMAVLFVRAELRASHPVLDVRYFARRDFSAAAVIAATGYFGAFAVFFFIPLYLLLVGTSSGFDVAVDFIPMAAGAVGASMVAGRWVANRGPRMPMATGCVLVGASILAVDSLIDPHTGPGTLSWSLLLVGIGLGLITVSVNAAALSAVPPERSGMAASTVNTCRELGALVGVSVLGAIVNAHLTIGLTARLKAIGIPADFRNQVIAAITTGATSQAKGVEQSSPGLTTIINRVIGQAYGAFGDGLHLVLTISGIVLLASALLAITVPNRLRLSAEEADERQNGQERTRSAATAS